MILIDGEELLNDINESIEIESESESADTMKSKIVISALRIARKYVRRFIEFKSPWISVKDRMPDDGVEVLVYDTYCRTLMGWYDKGDDCFRSEYINCLDEVTRWMPLPEEPKEDKDG